MARRQNNTNQNQEQRRGQLKELPTLAHSYIMEMIGAGVWTPDKEAKLSQLVLNAINNDKTGVLLQRMSVVSHTMSPEIKEQMDSLSLQKTRIEKRIERRNEMFEAKRHNIAFDEKTGKQRTEKQMKKLFGENVLEDLEKEEHLLNLRNASDDNKLTRTVKEIGKLKYYDDVDKRNVEMVNRQNQSKTEKLIDTINASEEKKEEEKEKRKQAKTKLIGGAIAETISGIGEGFQQGRHLRGY